MGARRIIVLVLAVVIAGGAAMYARSWIEGQKPVAVAAPAPKEEIHEVLVAAVNLPTGMFVKPNQLRWQRWPTSDVPRTYVLKGARSQEEMIGAVVRLGIAAGEPITDGKLVKPGERGFLAAVLSPGMRAISVPINPTSSNSGLIFPGDRVDLILTQTLASEGEGTRRVSETVLRDLRVLAMGEETSDTPPEGKTHEKARTATLEVTPRQAEEVTLVTELGKLSLSLRSLAKAEADEATDSAGAEDAQPYTWDSDVSRVLREDGSTARMLVLRGNKSQDVSLQKGTE